MDIVHKVLNVTIPPMSLALLLFVLPPYLFFKLLLSAARHVFSEDVAGKVILITGASPGIGEVVFAWVLKHLAYEYARRGACLALVARRENRLRDVAKTAVCFGSPDVLAITADVSKVEDLDHLVNNAGIVPVCLFEETIDVTNLAPAVDINFWGSVYGTYFAIPHLKRSGGRIVAITSSAGWLRAPRLSMYGATKAAAIAFYETLKVEIGREVGITIVTPGMIESEISQGKFLSKEGQVVLDQELRDLEVSIIPILPVKEAAKSIVDSACRGENYLTVPAWIWQSFYWKVFFPEILEWCNRTLLISKAGNHERDTLSKKLLYLTGLKQHLYPETVRDPHVKEQ